MEKVPADVLYPILKVCINAIKFRLVFNTKPSETEKDKCNLSYIYLFPKDNDNSNGSYTISSQNLYDYFDKKGYIFTVCKYNSFISDDYSFNVNTIVLVLPEYIDFDSPSTRTKFKLSSDIEYGNVLYSSHITDLVKYCYGMLPISDKNVLENNEIMKAMLHEYSS